MKRYFFMILMILLILPLWSDGIQWLTDYDQAREIAARKGQNVMVLLTAPSWCGYCQWMDANTFSDPEIISFVNQGFVPVKITDEDPAVEGFNFSGFPTTQIFSAAGELQKEGVGALDSPTFKSLFTSYASAGQAGDPLKLYGRESSERTKELKTYFESMGIAYEFHDVNIPAERSEIKKAIEDFGWKGTIYLPIIVIGDLIYFPPN